MAVESDDPDENAVIDALGKTMAGLVTVSRANDGVEFLAELLGVLARGHLCQVSSLETTESIVEDLVESFSTSYSDLKEKRGDRSSSVEDLGDRRSGARIFGERERERERSSSQVTAKDGGKCRCSKDFQRSRREFTRVSQQSGAPRPEITDPEKESIVEEDGFVEGKSQEQYHEVEEMEYFVEEEEDSGGTEELVAFTTGSSVAIFQETLMEQRRSNSLKEMELVCAMRGLKLKERELDMQEASIDIGKETLDVSKSTLKFNVSKAGRDEMAAACADFRRSTSDYFLAGLLIMFAFTAFCVWRNLPEWFSTLRDSCSAAPATKQAWYNFVGSITGNTNYWLCIARGSAGAILGVLLCLLLLFICKKTLSSTKRAMPMTIFMVGGSCVGVVGKEIVYLLGGQGWNWMVVWLLSCLVHACTHFFTEFFIKLLSRSRVVKIVFHSTLAVGLPLGAGLAGFPSVSSF
ncbi:uncharacterized protein LOC112346738 [Selaginella moellendorffii]|uniref:uncharacterized protein LOC112346738 n=1 Tax=Selaginella moellendorffii TaxID=88036 RepID=UPI000D1CCDBC|nr:uncharacterized protein LOC112346738 [Selaginella moellendorffii]|eukprot:XP_024532087.1 uncharacterized protein LOC112346738 [Selaginella moellendorffii]